MSDWEDALMPEPGGPAPEPGPVPEAEPAGTFRAVWGHGVCPETDTCHYVDATESAHHCYVCGAEL